MKKRLIPKEILEHLPIKYFFLDEIDFKDKKRVTEVRMKASMSYNSKQTVCVNNYRKTSKMLDSNEDK